MKKLFLSALFFGAFSCAYAASSTSHNNQQAEAAPTVAKLTGVDSNNTPINLQSLNGKVVLLTFYTAGCSICERDVKLMREFYRDNRNKDFVLIGVITEKKKEDFESYARIVKLATPKDQQFRMMWKSHIQSMEGIATIKTDPTHLVINRKGEIILRREGMFRSEDWDFLWESIENNKL